MRPRGCVDSARAQRGGAALLLIRAGDVVEAAPDRSPAERHALNDHPIIRHLTALEDRPWTDYAHGHPITPRLLANLLDGFGINAKQIRLGPRTLKGYRRADFTDAFCRYLADPKQRNTVLTSRP